MHIRLFRAARRLYRAHGWLPTSTMRQIFRELVSALASLDWFTLHSLPAIGVVPPGTGSPRTDNLADPMAATDVPT